MKSAVRQGVRKFLLQSPDFFNIPDSVQQQIEETVVDHVAGRLLTRFRQIDAVLDGSFRIAKDFIEKSFHDAALMYIFNVPESSMTPLFYLLSFDLKVPLAKRADDGTITIHCSRNGGKGVDFTPLSGFGPANKQWS